MSRIGKAPIAIPKGVTIEIQESSFRAKGPKGVVVEPLFPECPVEEKDGEIQVSRTSDEKPVRAKHGLARSLLANAIQGVSEGFVKQLDVVGVGYRGDVKGSEIHLSLGFSHTVIYPIPDGIEVEIDKNNRITLRGANKQQVGQVAAELRALRPPDPYKAKGVRYVDEQIRRKVGKAGAR